jgi:hypothetical protein
MMSKQVVIIAAISAIVSLVLIIVFFCTLACSKRIGSHAELGVVIMKLVSCKLRPVI